jgi:hypothetical protein
MPKVGIIAGLYVSTAVHATPAFVEIDLVGDASVNFAWEEGEATTRQSLVNQSEPTKAALEVTGRVRVEVPNNAIFNTIEKAAIGRTVLDVLALNGKKDVPGSRGYRFDGKIFNWGEDQALGNVIFKDFNLKPCPSDNDPKFVEVDPAGVVVEFDLGASPDIPSV